jgi:hypothetical protein
MREKISILTLLFAVLIIFSSCNTDNLSVPFSDWNIPEKDIISGGPAKDGIPSLFNPRTISAAEANYLSDEDLVVGIVVNGEARAYPHTILDWHEVVNEDFSRDKPLTISYCPLTGTSIIFEGNNSGRKLTFGVSGLLYNNNLIMFDRQTNSHWPQMRLQCDQGTLRNTKQKVYPAIETSWGSWKKLQPNTVVLSTNTGFARPYDRPGSAYPGYTDPNAPPLFSNAVSFRDDRLPPKQRVHGVIAGDGPDNYKTRVYVIDRTRQTRIINDSFENEPIVVIDDGKSNFVLSYFRVVDGTDLTFTLADGNSSFPFTFRDNETGSTWNVFGEAVDGPLSGKKLVRTLSYNAYRFAWATFYIGAEIFEG